MGDNERRKVMLSVAACWIFWSFPNIPGICIFVVAPTCDEGKLI